MASQIQAPKKAGNSLLQRLPRFSNSVWLIIILCLFLIAMIPMATGYMERASKQEALRLQVNQLQSQYDAIKAKMAGQAALSSEVGKLKAEAEAAQLQYKNVADNPEVSQAIMALAWKYDITIISMDVSVSKGTVLGTSYPALTYFLSMSGQVANFQNFLIAVGNQLPSSQYLNIALTPATVEGELDNATIGIQIYCNNN